MPVDSRAAAAPAAPRPSVNPCCPIPPSVPPEPGSAGAPSSWRVLEPRTRPALTQLEGNGIFSEALLLLLRTLLPSDLGVRSLPPLLSPRD